MQILMDEGLRKDRYEKRQVKTREPDRSHKVGEDDQHHGHLAHGRGRPAPRSPRPWARTTSTTVTSSIGEDDHHQGHLPHVRGRPSPRSPRPWARTTSTTVTSPVGKDDHHQGHLAHGRGRPAPRSPCPWARTIRARLAGRISPLHRLKHLVSLDVSQNRFSGTIGHQILTFPEISHINVSFNQFISIEVVQVTGIESRLRILDAEGNQLQGHLPLNLPTYGNLKDINLRSNKFSGDIPRIYGKRLENNSWRSLYLENNYLTGLLPEEFLRLSKQVRGSLSNNCLHCPKNVPICKGVQKAKSHCTNAMREKGLE
ncbi:hypothetical protein F2Q68_00026125 [Brassica cretica]|uniref:Leucine-rich repeat-containing N-terminal plant-type domain-containing protein n=1 Tax=Brassica cretica TaxID=69181 RepID=A0A8S9IBW7_BRACR|nr:hypothetical protein F2Q68_00026125 [Brassica cretica]